MRRLILISMAALMGACSTQSPQSLQPPENFNPAFAQITVQRPFSMVGGGSSYVHTLFDTGSGIDYNADVPEPGVSGMDHFVLIDEITPELFGQMKFFNVFGSAPAPWQEPESRNPLQDHERISERVDETLFGATLVKKVDISRGGALVDALNTTNSKGGELQRVKLMQLYDRRERVLYRVLESRDERCFGPDLTGIRADLIEPAFSDLAPDFKNRSMDYLYAEICGLHVSFELRWNAYHIGSLPGFSPLTWERAPGRMALYAVLRTARVYANEITVEAGRQYVGIYDPNTMTFVIEAVELQPK
ncbi:MAG: hypothetical protein R3E82_03720 [Pseudomonadales bacterium]